MFKNLLVASVGLALVGLGPTFALANSTMPSVSKGDLASVCQPANGGGDQDVMLNLGQGNSVAITVHCDKSGSTTVGANTDTGESEKGATEAAEGGVED